MSDQVVLVTGGSGFLASNLIKLLLEEGYRVRTTVRDAKNESKIKHLHQLCPESKSAVEIVEADLTNPDSWHKAVEDCSFVHHVASPFPLDVPKNDDDIIVPAVEGTLNLLKACSAAKTVKRVVVTSSSIAILNDKPIGTLFTESDWIDVEDKNQSAYARSKGLAEKAAWKYVEDLPDGEKFELAVVNPTLIVGPVESGTSGSSISILQKFLKREYPMLPNICMPTCDVRDCAQAHLKCMTLSEAVGQRHLVYTDNLWFKQISEILDKEFKPQGYNVPTKIMPNFVMSILAVFISELRNAKTLTKAMPIDNSRMTHVLGITPTPLDKSVLDMAYSMIEKGFVPKTSQYKGALPVGPEHCPA